MTVQIDRFTPFVPLTASAGAGPVRAPRELPATTRPVTDAQATGTLLGDVPPAPTPKAREMVDRAAERVQELQGQNRQLHFVREPDSNRVVIEVRDLDGNVLKTIPPAKALDVMSGAEI